MEMELRWGIIGCGFVGADFVTALKLLPKGQHKVTAVAAGSKDRAEAFKEKNALADASAYGDYESVYKDPNVDIVYVGNLNHQHKACTLGALRGGKHVLVEKAMGVNKKEVEEMIAEAQKQKRFLMEGYWSRFFPVYQKVRESIAAGEIGNVRSVLVSFGYTLQKSFGVYPRIAEAKFGGEGVMYDIGVYCVQFALMALGTEGLESSEFVGRKFPSGVDETGSLTLFYSDGRSANLFWSGAADLPNEAVVMGDVKMPGTDPERGPVARIRIPGFFNCPDKVELPSGAVEVALPAGDEAFNFPHSSGFAYEAACVRECIIKGEVECPRMTHKESLIIADVLEKARQSAGIVFPQDA